LKAAPSREDLNVPFALEYNSMVAVSLLTEETEPLAKNKIKNK